MFVVVKTKTEVRLRFSNVIVFCNACCIGKPNRHLATRIHEHLFTDKKSFTYKQLSKSTICHGKSDHNSFTIIDSVHTKLQLKIQKAFTSADKILNRENVPHSPCSIKCIVQCYILSGVLQTVLLFVLLVPDDASCAIETCRTFGVFPSFNKMSFISVVSCVFLI